MVALMVPLIEAAVIDAFAAIGFITFSYAEHFALGVVGQLS